MATVSKQTTDTDTDYEEKEEHYIREAWTVDSFCLVYSRSKQQWFDGKISRIEHLDRKEWLIVKYGNSSKRIQRHCSDIKPIPLNHPSLFEEGSICQIYSRNKWCNGEVIEVYNDEEGEWLKIKYSEKGCVKLCDVQRYCAEIKLIKNVKHLKQVNVETTNSLRSIWKTHGKAMEEWLEKENQENISAPWTLKCDNIALYRTIKYSNIIELNHYEFIVAPYQSFEEPIENNGIYKYNIVRDEWTLLIKYPPQFVAEQHSIAMDSTQQCIYIYYYLGALCKIHLKTNHFEWFTPKDDDDYKNEGDSAIFGEGAAIVVIDSKLNIMWSKDSATHQVYHENTRTLDIMQTFDFKDESKGRISYGMIHNSVEKYILLLGGFKGGGLGRSDEIWKYSLTHKTWNLFQIRLPDKMQSFGCVIDLNCEYILVFGGSDSNGFSDRIWILTLSAMKWTKSKVICPFKGVGTGSVVITKTDDDIQTIHLLQGNYRHLSVLLSDILCT